MDDDDSVLSRFDHLVEVADRAVPCGDGQRAIDPDRFFTANEKPPREITRREVVVTRDGDEWTFELPRHVLDEPRLSAAGGPFEHHRESAVMTLGEDVDLI